MATGGGHEASRGFSLIELMVVVGIIGVLVAIAAPNFIRYKAKACQAEVRTNLGAIYKAQQTVNSEHGYFSDDLATIGWAPEGYPKYIYGHTSDVSPAASGRNDTAELKAAVGGRYGTSKMVDAFGVPLTDANLPDATVSSGAFTVGAAGNVDSDATLDLWTLDDSGSVTHFTDDVSE